MFPTKSKRLDVLLHGGTESAVAEKHSELMRGVINCMAELMQLVDENYRRKHLEATEEGIGSQVRNTMMEDGGAGDEGSRFKTYAVNLKRRLEAKDEDSVSYLDTDSDREQDEEEENRRFLHREDHLNEERRLLIEKMRRMNDDDFDEDQREFREK